MIAFIDILRACRRSRIKFRVYKALVESSPALPGELAAAAQTTIERVSAVIHGDGERFRYDTALVFLGAVVAVRTERGLAYTATEHGRAAWAFVSDRIGRRDR